MIYKLLNNHSKRNEPVLKKIVHLLIYLQNQLTQSFDWLSTTHWSYTVYEISDKFYLLNEIFRRLCKIQIVQKFKKRFFNIFLKLFL